MGRKTKTLDWLVSEELVQNFETFWEMDGEHPEWLPVDWKVCVRVRSSGKKDKYYVNPSNDLKFNSKPEVLRYLKNAVKDPKGRKLNKVSERLPSGWIEETRITRKGGKTRRDPYFIDPISGRHFRSIQEVKRYLETKNSEKPECTTDDPDHPSEELGDRCKSSTAGAEGQKLINEKVDKTSSGNESIKLESAAVENINPPETDASGGIEKEKESTAEDEQQEKAAVRKKRKKNSKWMNGLPRRASKRLARVEADPPLEVKTSSRAREAARLPDEAEVNTDDTTGKSKLSEVNTSEDLDKQKEATTNLPVGNLSSAEEHECASVDLKQDEKNEKKLDSSLNDLFMDPCIEFAIKTLTGAIPLEEVSKICDSSVASPVQASASSSVLPFSDIWADPCFEFAVKTLTSEIPTEDGSHFQISFSSGTTGCNSIAK